MINSDTGISTARILLDVLIEHHVETVIISPGSRNTPLSIGINARKKLKKYVINDERTASFIALGLSLSSQKPVALICTSGSALYNYAPAVSEAFYQHIPLILISADRPEQWIGQDSQTLRQFESLRNIVKGSYNIPGQFSMSSPSCNEVFNSDLEWYANRISNQAVNLAMNGIKGPVHINIQFENPFNTTTEYKNTIPRIIKFIHYNCLLPDSAKQEIASELLDKKILVVAGQHITNHKLNNAIKDFSELQNVFVLSEPTSNIHLKSNNLVCDNLFNDKYSKSLKRLEPDIIITLGGYIISDQFKFYIKNLKDVEIWSLCDSEIDKDSYMRLSRHYDISPEIFFKVISAKLKRLFQKKNLHSNYKNDWELLMELCRTEYYTEIAQNHWDENKVIFTILNKIPQKFNLFVSNGMIIRRVNNLISNLPHNCLANRGVSGIEGTNSTALGVSLNYKGTTLLLTGDVSFSYNPEILNLSKLGGDLRIILINNKGGGIFREIKTTKDLECVETYFCNDPSLPIKGIAEAYDWHYKYADTPEMLENNMEFILNHKKTILEIRI